MSDSDSDYSTGPVTSQGGRRRSRSPFKLIQYKSGSPLSPVQRAARLSTHGKSHAAQVRRRSTLRGTKYGKSVSPDKLGQLDRLVRVRSLSKRLQGGFPSKQACHEYMGVRGSTEAKKHGWSTHKQHAYVKEHQDKYCGSSGRPSKGYVGPESPLRRSFSPDKRRRSSRRSSSRSRSRSRSRTRSRGGRVSHGRGSPVSDIVKPKNISKLWSKKRSRSSSRSASRSRSRSRSSRWRSRSPARRR